MRRANTAPPPPWQFVATRSDQGDWAWTWQRNDARQGQSEQSPTSFRTLNECRHDASGHGYVA
jgi:hypothetical protein